MNRVTLLYVGILFTVVLSFAGLTIIPQHQLGSLEPIVNDDGTEYPVEPTGLVAHGRSVYVSLGCMYCHSQQVRPPGFGADIDRGWGSRRTVARDHIYDQPPLLSTMRTGPDLANIGVRQPSSDWHLLHLYNPEITSPGSIMAPYGFLFDELALKVERPYDALSFPPEWDPGEDVLIVPTYDAKALVAYLISLNASHPVPEVPQ